MTLSHVGSCRRALFAAIAAACIALPAEAADATAASAASAGELKRIATERAEIGARFVKRERECRTRFVVTSCVDDAKRERRQDLDRLRERQLAVDEAQRRERASGRKAELAAKAVEDAKRDADRAARFAAHPASGAASQGASGLVEPRRQATPERAASAPKRGPHPPAKAPVNAPRPRESAALRQERETRSRAVFETRQRQAAEHRDESAAGAIRRMATKAPAAPLPAPSAASAAVKSR